MSMMLEKAEKNENGEYIYTYTKRALAGGTSEFTTNVSALLRPGGRKTGKVDHLVIEAQLYDERDKEDWGGNPARPVDSETAKRAIERIEEEGLTPAWRLVQEPGDFP